MKITKLSIRNYRSIQEVTLDFPSFYTAVCGRNDAGKTNVLRALRALIHEPSMPYFDRPIDISTKHDWPVWNTAENKNKSINLSLECVVYPDNDGGLYKFIIDYLGLKDRNEEIRVELRLDISESGSKSTSVVVDGVEQETLKAQEVVNKFRSSGVIIFHNSTEFWPSVFVDSESKLLGEIQESDSAKLQKAKNTLDSQIRKLAKKQEREFEELLGRLQQKYKVVVSTPKFEISGMPLSINLGDDRANMPLENWGSGTQNRTKILMALFKAKRVSQSETSASKVTPVLVIEEPESFLHPSAQAEFGAVIQELSEEFEVQVIVTTHSPHMLSCKKAESNILLRRNVDRKRLRETTVVKADGDRWMEPYALALGINSELFTPWKDVLFHQDNAVVLVEGDIDRKYMEFLRENRHGQHKLKFLGAVVPYNGKDTLKSSGILKFVRERFKHCVITYDLDAARGVENSLKQAGFVIGQTAIAVGLDEAGKRDIEGLLPNSVISDISGRHPDLVRQGMSSNTEEKTSAKNKLKALYYEKVNSIPNPAQDEFKDFYKLARKIEKAFK